MSQLPSMPVWVADFFSKTDHLSNEEQWAYLKLMMKTWARNCRPLPDNDTDIARLLDMGVKRWRKIRPRLEPFFDLSARTWVQPHLENVFLEATQRKEKIVSSARLGGIAKSNKINEVLLPSAPERQCQPKPYIKEESGSSLSPDSESEERSEKERELPSVGLQKQYEYTGELVRLTKSDLDQWRESYSGIPDVLAAIKELDGYFHRNLKGGDRKNWFFRVSGQLERKHQDFLLRERRTKRFLNEHGVTPMHPGAGG